MNNTIYATPIQELNDDMEDSKIRIVEVEMEIEKVHADYERKLQEQTISAKALSTEAANYKIKGDLERKANDRLQNEKRELQEQVEEYKLAADKQKRHIAELEIELEKSFNNERVLRDKIEQLEESQGSAMEKVADMETRLIEMEQRARDADYFPMPILPAISNGIQKDGNKINGEVENKASLKSITKKKESRNSVQVIDDLIEIIEVGKFEILLFKEEDNKK
uniref:Uncharacterized protein n=1 Tax=Panagrolaimus sp. ES5 TaxID=591445 RepID=A0AC34GS14_9BILA